MKKLLLLFAFLTLSVGLWAIDNVAYIDADGNSLTANNVTEISDSGDPVTWGETGKTTWYVVKSKDAKLLGGVICQGDVNLILADGANLIANLSSNKNKAGIQVSGDGNSLTIYGQTNQTGELKAYGGDNAAGIGGVIEGDGSNITINGGIVGASGGKNAAGIGGGAGTSGSNITINGGKVTAYGGMYGAGIGGGSSRPGFNITITGGRVTAYGGQYAAGIGGGYYGHGSNISITGGTVTANGEEGADGIGNGNAPMKESSNITVATTLQVKAGVSENPTDVISNTGSDLAGSLAGKQYATIKVPVASEPVNAAYIDENGDAQTADAWEVESSDSPVTLGEAAATTWYVITGEVYLDNAICQGDVRLILADGAKLMATGDDTNKTPGIQVSGEGNYLTIYGQTNQTGKIIANGGEYAAGIGGGNEADGSNITINGGIIVSNGGNFAAGIGGGSKGSGSDITVNGGTITANGGNFAAGIGGGWNGSGSNITVATTLQVKASGKNPPTSVIENTGSDLASSLAGKRYVTIEPPISYIDEKGKTQTAFADVISSSSTPVTWGATGTTTWYVIKGADVQLSQGAICSGAVHLILADGAKLTATGISGDLDTPGIQVSGEGNSLTIYGQSAQSGQLIATGEDDAAAIGGGYEQSSSNITINGGTVTATTTGAVPGGAGIGGGRSAGGSNITINNGTVYAASYSGAGIGGGDAGSGSNITINGGIVTASSIYGAGIGGGAGGSGSNITIYGGKVTASSSSSGAGIGGGAGGSGSNITIKGGTITASGNAGAGIGGGDVGSGSDITIIDGIVTANSSSRGAGIGGGGSASSSRDGGSGSNITIKGGTVTANGGLLGGAGIGGGSCLDSSTVGGDCTNITINGGTVTANGGANSSGIGSTAKGHVSDITINGGTVKVTAGSGCYAFGTGTKHGSLAFNVDTSLIVRTGKDEMSARKIKPANPDKPTEYGSSYLSSYVYIEPLVLVPVAYGDENGVEQTANATVVTSSANRVYWIDGWYVVKGEVSLSQGAVCNGNVHLILADGAKLTADGGGANTYAGIQVTDQGNSLTIYGQTAQSGQLNAIGGYRHPGIGGGGYNSDGSDITINGGIVTATGGGDAAGIGGAASGSGSNITINGGTVTAIGGTDGVSGIGSGKNGSASSNIKVVPSLSIKADGNNPPTTVIGNTGTDLANDLAGKRYVTIEMLEHATVTYLDENGTEKTALAYEVIDASSPMALGWNGHTIWYIVQGTNVQLSQGAVCHGDVRLILVDGAKLTANGADNKAGIQVSGSGNALTIYGQTNQTGQLIANGGINAAGIGGGNGSSGSNITINGGKVMANGNEGASGIGSGKDGPASSNIKVSTLFSLKADGNNPPTTVIGNSGSDLANDLAGKRYVTIEKNEPTAVTYLDEDGVEKTIKAYELGGVSSLMNLGHDGNITWHVVQGTDVQLSQGAVCHGDVRLILADGAKLTANGAYLLAGIQVSGEGNSLTIYGQTNQTGQLIANGGDYGAGIGSREGANSSNITINGGTVTAKGGKQAAGIGSGFLGNGTDITINGGTVTATGGDYGAGIGGGGRNYGTDITINGGMVTATGGNYGAGVGSGRYGDASSNIFVASIFIVKADGNNPPTTVIENTGSDLAGSLAGKQYVTVSDAVCNITANQDPDHIKNYYSTFYSGKKAYEVPDDVTAYTGVADGSVLTLTPVANGIIPAGEAVILRLTTDDNTAMTQKIQLTATTTTATKSTDNMLQGSDTEKTLPQNSYALSLGQHGVGFYKFGGDTLPAHKAYLTYASGSAISLRFSFGDATDIDTIETEAPAKAYNLQGQQVDENYKGIVIVNGKKVLNN